MYYVSVNVNALDLKSLVGFLSPLSGPSKSTPPHYFDLITFDTQRVAGGFQDCNRRLYLPIGNIK